MTPEILAPAGDPDSLHVALEAGADAVYFGLDEGFNARGRATNFPVDDLPRRVGQTHRAGARAYLALNTLVFEPELEIVEGLVRSAAQAGVDALIVQDPGLALLARAICPDLEVHASTQMTISSAEGARFAQTLGITRIVAPRELSVEEIRRLVASTHLEVEVFIMGALCMAWSGQCLSSEAWGGRSANRGQCAQACRLPYDLVVDGQPRPLGEVSYLLSPRDLAGFRAVRALAEAGVHTLKIEGRQKSPTYVRTATESLRGWLDAIRAGAEDEQQLALFMRDLTLAYSRGFGDGFLAGPDHQTLVDGRAPKHRGQLLGRVHSIQGDRARVVPERSSPSPARGRIRAPLPALGGSEEAASGPATAPPRPRPGVGVVFDRGKPGEPEEGGPIFAVEGTPGAPVLVFGRPGPDLTRVQPGDRVWLTSDPELQARTQRSLRQPLTGRIPISLEIHGRVGGPLEVRARGQRVLSRLPLQPARGRSLDKATLAEKLGGLGGTPFRMERMEIDLEPGLFLPPSELKALRRELVERLEQGLTAGPARRLRPEPQLPSLRSLIPAGSAGPTRLVALCRTEEQLEAALEAGLEELELDWMELTGLGAAFRRARAAGVRVGVATVRVQKPGEEVYDRRLQALSPDFVLVRHWGGVMHFSSLPGAEVHGDFSLNVTNSLTAHHLLALGLRTVTAAHDLDERQLMALLEAVPPARVAVTLHHHIPTFHTEHCVYAHLLSQGRDERTCGRPCERHRVSLRDRTGREHPVLVDVGCRNTVFNSAAQSAAFLAPRLQALGVARLRVEFVREDRAQARAVLEAYRALLAGAISPTELLSRVGAHEQFGVTRGTMQVLGPRP